MKTNRCQKCIHLWPSLSLADLRRRKNLVEVAPYFLRGQGRRFYYYLGRNALWQALKLLNLQADDEVLLPGYLSGTEVAPFQALKLKIKFYDLGNGLQIDTQQLLNLINRKTKAVFAIHYFGFPQDVERLREICREQKIFLIEDCALAAFSSIKDKPVGSFGDVAIYSLKKFLPVPNGGVLVVNNQELVNETPVVQQEPSLISSGIEFLSLIINGLAVRQHFVWDFYQLRFKPWWQSSWGGKILDLNKFSTGGETFDQEKVHWSMCFLSKFLLKQLDYQSIMEKRRRNFQYFRESFQRLNLKEKGVIRFLVKDLPQGVVPFSFPLLVQDKQALLERLRREKLPSFHWWERNSLTKKLEAQRLPRSFDLYDHLVSLPVHQDLEINQLKQIFKVLADFLRGQSKTQPLAYQGRVIKDDFKEWSEEGNLVKEGGTAQIFVTNNDMCNFKSSL